MSSAAKTSSPEWKQCESVESFEWSVVPHIVQRHGGAREWSFQKVEMKEVAKRLVPKASLTMAFWLFVFFSSFLFWSRHRRRCECLKKGLTWCRK